jgi:hypothetical protein
MPYCISSLGLKGVGFAFSCIPTNPLASDPSSSQSQQKASPTEKKAKYDPTIENILKSIGFDFEMSKRMQEKANPTPFKPKEEMQYGIDQSSSSAVLDGHCMVDSVAVVEVGLDFSHQLCMLQNKIQSEKVCLYFYIV